MTERKWIWIVLNVFVKGPEDFLKNEHNSKISGMLTWSGPGSVPASSLPPAILPHEGHAALGQSRGHSPVSKGSERAGLDCRPPPPPLLSSRGQEGTEVLSRPQPEDLVQGPSPCPERPSFPTKGIGRSWEVTNSHCDRAGRLGLPRRRQAYANDSSGWRRWFLELLCPIAFICDSVSGLGTEKRWQAQVSSETGHRDASCVLCVWCSEMPCFLTAHLAGGGRKRGEETMSDGLVCGRGQCWTSSQQERKDQVHIATPDEPRELTGVARLWKLLQTSTASPAPPKIRSLNSKRKISNSRNKKIMKFWPKIDKKFGYLKSI